MPQTALPTSADGREAFDVAEEAVRAAGTIIMEGLAQMAQPRGQRTISVSNKEGWNNLVTDVDRAAEKTILDILTASFPDDSILAEESGSRTGTSSYTWAVDPLDGTRNFASAISQLCVNVSLSEGSQLVLGLTYDPVRDELFHATLGGGAFINRTPIAISDQTELPECIVGCDMGYLGPEGKMLLDMLSALWPGVQSVRMMGSAALGVAYAAAGRFDMYVHHYVQPWDIAPGLLLVREAGGLATDLRGQDAVPASGCIVAAAPAIHKAFMAATEGSAWRRAQQG